MNDILESCNLFDFITDADDTTLTSIPSTFENTSAIDNSININTEIKKKEVSDWLKINKLSLNVIFHKHNKVLRIPNIILIMYLYNLLTVSISQELR